MNIVKIYIVNSLVNMSEIRKEKSRLNSLTGSRKDIGTIEKSKDSESLHESQKRVNIIELEAESKQYL